MRTKLSAVRALARQQFNLTRSWSSEEFHDRNGYHYGWIQGVMHAYAQVLQMLEDPVECGCVGCGRAPQKGGAQ